MSRHYIETRSPAIVVAVGWEGCLNAGEGGFFAQVSRYQNDTEELMCTVLGEPDAYGSLDSIQRDIREYAIVPEYVRQILRDDRQLSRAGRQ